MMDQIDWWECERMRLVQEDIILRHATVDDAKQLVVWWNDGSVMAHAGFPNGLGTTEEKVKKSIEKDSDENGRRLIIEFKGKAIGEMCYRNQEDNIAEIGIKICEASYQEKGIGRCVLRMLIQYLFQNGYKKIVLDTDLKNKRAQHVYEMLGF